jgi:hypothetical protein
MKKLALLGTIGMIVLLAVTASASAPNLVSNGSFELPEVSSGSWAVFETVTGWDIDWTNPTGNFHDPELEVWDNLYGHAYDGDQHVELDAYDPTTISQIVSTTSGYCYDLSYAWSPRPNVVDNQLKVWLNDSEIGHHKASGVGNTQTDWTLSTYQFVGSGADEVTFAEVGPDDQLGMLLDAVSVIECPAISVLVDIKPGSDPNCFNSDGHGVIPVAILGTADFDVSLVDPFSLSLDGSGVRVKGKSGNAGSLEDVNGDGYLDLVLQIEDDGDYAYGDTTATLTGRTYGGVKVVGTDAICLRPPE